MYTFTQYFKTKIKKNLFKKKENTSCSLVIAATNIFYMTNPQSEMGKWELLQQKKTKTE